MRRLLLSGLVLMCATPAVANAQGMFIEPRPTVLPRAQESDVDALLRDVRDTVLQRVGAVNVPSVTVQSVAQGLMERAPTPCNPPEGHDGLSSDAGWRDLAYRPLQWWTAKNLSLPLLLCVPADGDSIGRRVFHRVLDVNARILKRGRDTTMLRILSTWRADLPGAADSAMQAAWRVDRALQNDVIDKSVECSPVLSLAVSYHRTVQLLVLTSTPIVPGREQPCPMRAP
ncbi:MAG: hypothetical protein ACYC2K_10350 [Gemmatimonadales bacterium]